MRYNRKAISQEMAFFIAPGNKTGSASLLTGNNLYYGYALPSCVLSGAQIPL